MLCTARSPLLCASADVQRLAAEPGLSRGAPPPTAVTVNAARPLPCPAFVVLQAPRAAWSTSLRSLACWASRSWRAAECRACPAEKRCPASPPTMRGRAPAVLWGTASSQVHCRCVSAACVLLPLVPVLLAVLFCRHRRRLHRSHCCPSRRRRRHCCLPAAVRLLAGAQHELAAHCLRPLLLLCRPAAARVLLPLHGGARGPGGYHRQDLTLR